MLIICIECGKTYSDLAQECPQCACPTTYNKTSVDGLIVQGNESSFDRLGAAKTEDLLNYKHKKDDLNKELKLGLKHQEKIADELVCCDIDHAIEMEFLENNDDYDVDSIIDEVNEYENSDYYSKSEEEEELEDIMATKASYIRYSNEYDDIDNWD